MKYQSIFQNSADYITVKSFGISSGVGGGEGANAPARSSSPALVLANFPARSGRRASKPRSTPPEIRRSVYSSRKKPTEKNACGRMHQLDWTPRTVISRFNPHPTPFTPKYAYWGPGTAHPNHPLADPRCTTG